MSIDVLLGDTRVPVEEAVFEALLDNSVAGTYVAYKRALERKSIPFADLVDLARKGEIPYSLFFAPLLFVEAQVATNARKLLAGVSKDTFSVGSRESVELRDIELIVKDLGRKQALLKNHDKLLAVNKIVGMLRVPGTSEEEDAVKLNAAIGLSLDAMRRCRTKEKVLDLLIERLEDNQILISRSVQNYMPQRLKTNARFSGITIRDKKVPYIFLAGGDHGDHQEPVGRTIFTLALMAVLVARGVFKPVTWDGESTGTDFGREYDIAGAMLMPAARVKVMDLAELDDIKAASDEFKVTPSALTVRAMRLGKITSEVARSHLDALRVEFDARPKVAVRRAIRPENAVRKYNGRELSSRMLAVLDAGKISESEFCRAVCLNKLKPSQINDLRGALG